MAEYVEYRQNNMDGLLNYTYGIELFPSLCNNPVIKKNTREEALSKFKKLLTSKGFDYLAGKITIIAYLLLDTNE